MVLAAILSGTGCEKLDNLTLDVQNPAEGGANLTISQGKTLEIPFTIGQLDEYTAQVSVTCDNNAYSVEAILEGAASGKIILTAPEFILEDATINIELTAVDAENSRTVKQTITVSAQSTLQKLTVASNCHLTSPGAFISFAAVKGNSTEKLENIAKAELLWEDALDLVDSVFTVDGKDMYVVLAGEKQGNAVVAAKNAEGTILWSWHIWVSAEDATANTMSYTYTKNDVSTTYHFMDRNLGALTSELGTDAVNGCFYQWGRKDPFPASNYEGGLKKIYDMNGEEMSIATETTPNENNIQTAIQNPATRYTTAYSNGQSWMTSNTTSFNIDDAKDLWGYVSGQKTIYDPCPAGYKMPVTDAWRFWADANVPEEAIKTETGKILGYKVTILDKGYVFPAQGHINHDNNSIADCLVNAYHPEINGYAYGRQWHSQFVSDYFKAYATETYPGSSECGYSHSTAHSYSVRCIKE